MKNEMKITGDQLNFSKFTVRSGFVNVDQQIDPHSFVAYLERMNSIPAVLNYKTKTIQLLDLSPEDSVLDIGCGVGLDVRTIANSQKLKNVVGIDSSATMIKDAKAAIRRDSKSDNIAIFQQNDAHNLSFDDNSFEAVRSDRTFQHLENPKTALKEAIRVAKPNGRIVISEPDWEELEITGINSETEEIIRKTYVGIIRNCRIGNQLKDLFLDKGIKKVEIYKARLLVDNFKDLNDLWWLDKSLEKAADTEIITQNDMRNCIKDLTDINKLEASLPIYIAKGIKP